jgi:hypothetical protein
MEREEDRERVEGREREGARKGSEAAYTMDKGEGIERG